MEKDNYCTVFMDKMKVHNDGIQDLVMAMENCLDSPMLVMPMKFISIDTRLFVRLMEAHKNWLTLFYGEDALEKANGSPWEIDSHILNKCCFCQCY